MLLLPFERLLIAAELLHPALVDLLLNGVEALFFVPGDLVEGLLNGGFARLFQSFIMLDEFFMLLLLFREALLVSLQIERIARFGVDPAAGDGIPHNEDLGSVRGDGDHHGFRLGGGCRSGQAADGSASSTSRRTAQSGRDGRDQRDQRGGKWPGVFGCLIFFAVFAFRPAVFPLGIGRLAVIHRGIIFRILRGRNDFRRFFRCRYDGSGLLLGFHFQIDHDGDRFLHNDARGPAAIKGARDGYRFRAGRDGRLHLIRKRELFTGSEV